MKKYIENIYVGYAINYVLKWLIYTYNIIKHKTNFLLIT